MKNLTLIAIITAILSANAAYAAPTLNSYPTAAATLYLDFDGHDVNSSMWNYGTPFSCLHRNLQQGSRRFQAIQHQCNHRSCKIPCSTNFSENPYCCNPHQRMVCRCGWYRLCNIFYLGRRYTRFCIQRSLGKQCQKSCRSGIS